jgi:Haem-NO-binding
MYGMINLAIREMVIEYYGDNTWNELKKRTGGDGEEFVSMNAYPDALTYQMVGHLTGLLSVPADKLLEKIGEYWITHTANQGYGPILDMAGNNLVEFLKNLNTMHRGVANSMPEMVIPIFTVTDEKPRSIVLEYHSRREGLQPMVLGLIKGLGQRFGVTCKISMIDTPPSEHTFQRYLITW